MILKKNEILEELRTVKYNDIEALVYRMKQLTYDEIIGILDLKFFPTKRTGYSLNPGFNEVVDLNETLKYILPENVEVNFTVDDISLKFNIKINQTLIFNKKSFFIGFQVLLDHNFILWTLLKDFIN